ncbi:MULTISPECIES: SDR family oxidoreductase [unclassified Streptomyces]|uniref:SDR family oxidoreductase n=1 Tax=unclassified Streptomyces TaxID=2593676 RepID=UPI0009A0C1F8|nr:MULTISPECIES: NmrA family NAD(P)-binding protein [unclassified Streptomyces]MCD2464311.1 NmrA family NAD(P)-binding protein [Streptomyces sp. MBT42]
MSSEIPMRVAVVGATGFQGGAVARLLTERHHRVHTLTRRPSADRPPLPGAAFVAGDLGRPDDVRRLFEGTTHAFMTMPLVYEGERVEAYARNVAAAALEAGTERLVFNSNTRIPLGPTDVAAFETRRLAERVLRDSGVPLVVIRPPVYLDNLFSPWNGPSLVDDGVLAYPLPAAARTAWLSHRGLAEAALAALSREDLEGRTFDIGGERSLTGGELAAAFGRGLGRAVRYEELDPAAFERSLGRLLGPETAAGVAGIYHFMASGADPLLMADDDGVSTEVLGLEPPPVEEWVARQPWQVWSSGESSRH